jgi:hypothetical protein
VECGADDELSIKEFWRQLNIKVAIFMFPILRVFDVRGDSQEHNPRVQGELPVIVRKSVLISNMN